MLLPQQPIPMCYLCILSSCLNFTLDWVWLCINQSHKASEYLPRLIATGQEHLHMDRFEILCLFQCFACDCSQVFGCFTQGQGQTILKKTKVLCFNRRLEDLNLALHWKKCIALVFYVLWVLQIHFSTQYIMHYTIQY